MIRSQRGYKKVRANHKFIYEKRVIVIKKRTTPIQKNMSNHFFPLMDHHSCAASISNIYYFPESLKLPAVVQDSESTPDSERSSLPFECNSAAVTSPVGYHTLQTLPPHVYGEFVESATCRTHRRGAFFQHLVLLRTWALNLRGEDYTEGVKSEVAERHG